MMIVSRNRKVADLKATTYEGLICNRRILSCVDFPGAISAITVSGLCIVTVNREL